MKHCRLIGLLLVVFSLSAQAQEGFSLEGTPGLSNPDKAQINSLLISGRYHWNPYVSTSIGIGLWNSGFKDSWLAPNDDLTAIFYKLTDNQTVPAIQWDVELRCPLLIPSIKLFVAPNLTLLSVTDRKVTLTKTYLIQETDPESQGIRYIPRNTDPVEQSSLETSSHSNLYPGFRTGIYLPLTKNMAVSLGCQFSKINLFYSLKNQSIDGVSLDPYCHIIASPLWQVRFVYYVASL